MEMARLSDFVPIEPAPPLVAYEGSAVWYMLRVMPMTEIRAAERLKVGNLIVYVPTFSKQVRRRGMGRYGKTVGRIGQRTDEVEND